MANVVESHGCKVNIFLVTETDIEQISNVVPGNLTVVRQTTLVIKCFGLVKKIINYGFSTCHVLNALMYVHITVCLMKLSIPIIRIIQNQIVRTAS